MTQKGQSPRREASRRYYERHRDEILAKRKAYRAKHGDRLNQDKRESRAILQDYVNRTKNIPCLDCGISYPSYVMDFDHVRGQKLSNIAFLVKVGCSLNLLSEEINKCDVVCANCHRIRTHTRNQCGALSL